MIIMLFSQINKTPRLSFKVRITMFFFLISMLVQLGIIAVVRYQIERANTAENYQYIEEESIVSATTIGELLWVNLEAIKLLSYNSQVINELIKSNRQYPSKSQDINQKLASLEKEWSASDKSSKLVKNVIDNTSSVELRKAINVLPYFNQLYITNKYGALVGSIKYTKRFDFHQQSWWQFTFNQGKGNIYIGKIRLDQKQDKLIVPFAIPVYSNEDSTQILGIIYCEHNLNDELKSIFNELGNRKRSLRQEESKRQDNEYLHRIYLDNNNYLDYENHQISRDSDLTLEKIKKQLQSGSHFTYQNRPSYLTAKQITSLERGTLFSKAIDNLEWYLVTIASVQKTNLLSLPTRILALLVIGILLLMLSILFTVYILNMITNPLKYMIEIAEEINNDQFKPESLDKINKAASLDNDIGKLARVFKNMSLIITSRTQNLQQQIEKLQLTSDKLLKQQHLVHDNSVNKLKDRVRLSILKKSRDLRNQISPNIAVPSKSSTSSVTSMELQTDSVSVNNSSFYHPTSNPPSKSPQVSSPTIPDSAPENIHLAQTYQENPASLLTNSTQVGMTKDTTNKILGGVWEKVYLEENRRTGEYLIVTSNTGKMHLFLNPNSMFNPQTLSTIHKSKVFICHGNLSQSRKGEDITIQKPATVKKEAQYWVLVESGEITI